MNIFPISSRGFTGMKMQRGAFALGMVVGLLVGLALALGVALYITKVPVPFVNKVPQRSAEQDSAEAERLRRWDPNAPLGGKSAPRPAGGTAAASAAGPFPPPPLTPAPSLPPPTTAAVPPGSLPPATAGRPAAPARDPGAILSGAPVSAAPASPAPPAAATPTRPVTAANPAAAANPSVSGTAAAPAPARSTAPQVDAFVYFVQAGAYTRNDDAEHQRARLGLMGYTATISEREQSGRTMYRVRVGPLRSRDEADGMQQRLQESAIETQIVRVERP
jgi:cell division protein FtsN